MKEAIIKTLKKDILNRLNQKMLGIEIPVSSENLTSLVSQKPRNPPIERKTAANINKKQSKSKTLKADNSLIKSNEFANVETTPCQICGRHFAVERIDKHSAICAGIKPRPVFDPKKMRAKGT